MQEAIDRFRENVTYVRKLNALHAAASRMSPPLDTSDIKRAQIVMVASALDHYVHEITRLGMLEILANKRPVTPAFSRFDVSTASAIAAASGTQPQWLENEIRQRHGWRSFQMPDKVADAIRLVSEKAIWEEVGALLGIPAADLKSRLELLVDRRNKIAHESDLDPSYPGLRWPIDSVMVSNAINFIEALVEKLHIVVTT